MFSFIQRFSLKVNVKVGRMGAGREGWGWGDVVVQ